MSSFSKDAEAVATFLLEAARRSCGPRWDQGPRPQPREAPPHGPSLRWLAERRVRRVPEPVVSALLGWARGERPAFATTRIPDAREMVAYQADGRRCVSLVDDATALAHGDPRHLDALSFVVHDLCHLEKFWEPEHHRGQVGFFATLARAIAAPGFAAFEAGFDDIWRAERDYVFADMNGSAVFLFAALKMKLKMAVRRARARRLGLPTWHLGPYAQEEWAAFSPALETLLELMGFHASERAAARLVSCRRDDPAAGRALLRAFEARAP